MPIVDQPYFDHCVDVNLDPYGKACVDTAIKAMEIMDAEPDAIHNLGALGLILRANKEAGCDGLSGFMAGCVAQIITKCHSRGSEFHTSWNKNWGEVLP